MSEQNLVLYPKGGTLSTEELALLTEKLVDQGFLGATFDFFGERRHRPGPKFFDLIRFTRSHRIIPLIEKEGRLIKGEAEDSRRHCQISLWSSPEEWILTGGEIMASPLCPDCDYELREWSAMLSGWYANRQGFLWQCPTCQSKMHPRDMDWRHRAGFGTCGITVEGVRHDEATPTEAFLSYLGEETGLSWNYLYSWF
jgi:hypothetical protein